MESNKVFVDNKWELEGFVTQKGATAGLKAGFVGVGQGGGKMVDALASIKDAASGNQVYPCIVANSNLGDLTNIKNVPDNLKFGMKGYETGVGKDPELGRVAFQKNGEKIFEAIANEMSGCDIIVVVVALGGGTGTGAINVLVEAIRSYLGKPVIAFTSLPRPNEIESRNAYNALSELVGKLSLTEQDEETGEPYRLLESLVILDNEKIFEEHIKEPEMKGLTWDFYSNYKLASVWHELSVLTSLGSDYTVDVADLMNHILLGGGVITFAKKKINLDDFKNQKDLINDIVSTYRGKNVLANGFDYEKDMRSMAMVVVMPKSRADELNQDTIELIRSKVREELPTVNFYPGIATNNSQRNAIVYTMANMAGLPERAKNLRNEAEELLKKREERESKASGFNMGEKLEVAKPKGTFAASKKGNPFAQKETAAASEASPAAKEKKNPFAAFAEKMGD